MDIYALASSGETDSVLRQVHSDAHSLNACDADGRTLLHHAATSGNIELVAALAELGADADTRDGGGWSPLHSASSAGRETIVSYLLQLLSKVQIDARVEGSGSTPLIYAASKGHAECVRLLLHASADIRERDSNQAGALHRAAGRGHVSVLAALLAKPPHSAINDSDSRGQTAFHVAAATGNDAACVMLAEAGADCRTTDAEGQMALELLTPSVRNQIGL